MLCNTHVKFDLFHQKARAIGAEKIATGHYARITRDDDGRFELRKALHLAKDQSYFLFELTQEQLRGALFPLGEMTKPEVRDIAEEAGLTVARKKESYEICFVPQTDGYAAIVEREAGNHAGRRRGRDRRRRRQGRRHARRLLPVHDRPAPRPRHRRQLASGCTSST